MFKKFLLVSIILHLLVLIGAERFVPQALPKVKPAFFELVSLAAPESRAATQSGKPGVASKNKQPPSNDLENKRIATDQPAVKNTSVNNTMVGIATVDATISQAPAVNPSNINSNSPPGTNSTDNGNSPSGIKPGGDPGAPESTFKIPIKIFHPDPVYPPTARQNGWEGTVLLEAVLNTDGRIGRITLIQSSGYPTLDNEAIKAVKRWRYQPAAKDGKPIAWHLRIKILFKLEE